MACAATGDVTDAVLSVGGGEFAGANLVFRNQIASERILIGETLAIERNGISAARRLIPHIEDLVARPQVFARVAMTVETPLHLQGVLLVHQRHGVHRAMARVAADALSHVDTVVEVDEVGKLVNARPLQGLSGAVTGADGLKKLGIRPYLRMAIHAGLCRRNAGEAGSLDRCVTIAAIDPQTRDVVLMAKGNGLRLSNTGIGNERGSLDFIKDPAESSNDEDCAKDSGAGQTIRAAMKNL